ASITPVRPARIISRFTISARAAGGAARRISTVSRMNGSSRIMDFESAIEGTVAPSAAATFSIVAVLARYRPLSYLLMCAPETLASRASFSIDIPRSLRSSRQFLPNCSLSVTGSQQGDDLDCGVDRCEESLHLRLRRWVLDSREAVRGDVRRGGRDDRDVLRDLRARGRAPCVRDGVQHVRRFDLRLVDLADVRQ